MRQFTVKTIAQGGDVLTIDKLEAPNLAQAIGIMAVNVTFARSIDADAMRFEIEEEGYAAA